VPLLLDDDELTELLDPPPTPPDELPLLLNDPPMPLDELSPPLDELAPLLDELVHSPLLPGSVERARQEAMDMAKAEAIKIVMKEVDPRRR
jgi:hypothetical protein